MQLIDAQFIIERTEAVGFLGASSLERMAVETSLTDLTRRFKGRITSFAGAGKFEAEFFLPRK